MSNTGPAAVRVDVARTTAGVTITATVDPVLVQLALALAGALLRRRPPRPARPAPRRALPLPIGSVTR